MVNQESEVFAEFIGVVMREGISVETFLEGRVMNALGEQPKVCEYFQKSKSKSFDHTIPSKIEYSEMIPLEAIKNKSSVKFKIIDMPNILQINSPFMSQLVLQPHNSQIFSTEFVQEILKYKWENYGYKYFLKDQILYFLFVLVFTSNSVLVIPHKLLYRDRGNAVKVVAWVMNICQILFLCRYILVSYDRY